MDHFTGPRGELDAFGNGANTQAHRINQVMSIIPQTLEQISSQSEVANLVRIRQHMQYLAGLGYTQHDGTTWALTERAAAKFSEYEKSLD